MKKLYKSKTDKKLEGVCAGIGNYFNLDPTTIRAGWAVVTLFTGCVFGVLAYIACAAIMPVEPDYIDENETDR